jgi:hypothetical protein
MGGATSGSTYVQSLTRDNYYLIPKSSLQLRWTSSYLIASITSSTLSAFVSCALQAAAPAAIHTILHTWRCRGFQYYRLPLVQQEEQQVHLQTWKKGDENRVWWDCLKIASFSFYQSATNLLMWALLVCETHLLLC